MLRVDATLLPQIMRQADQPANHAVRRVQARGIVEVISEPTPGDWFHEGIRRFTFGSSIAAAAANRTVIGLVNPAGSGVDLVIEQFSYAGVGAAALLARLRWGQTTTALVTLSSGLAGRDSRFGSINPGSQIPLALAAADNTLVAPGTAIGHQLLCPANDIRFIASLWVVSPGFWLVVSTENINTALNAGVDWYEVPISGR